MGGGCVRCGDGILVVRLSYELGDEVCVQSIYR